MFQCIEKAAGAMNALGVKKGDIVSLCMLTMPETIYTIYALNHLGAICNNIEPRTNAAQIRDRINNASSKILVVVDVFLNKILEIVSETKLEHIIVVPISRSMPFFAQKYFEICNHHKIQKAPDTPLFEYFDDFICRKASSEIYYPSYERNTPAVIIYTGGTTGVPKGAVLSNDSVTALAAQSIYDVPLLFQGERFLGIMPPFIAYGFVFGMFIPFCAGLEVILVPNFKAEILDQLIVKYKPNHVIGVPSFFERMTKSKKLRNKKLDFLMCVITGGDQLLENTEKCINSFLNEHGCKYKVLKGYGMTEMGSAATFTSTDECNVAGSVGIPSHEAVVKVIDHDTGEELTYNETGEICMRSPGMMLRYYQNDQETQKVMKLHSDGFYWIHTGDIGHMNEDGVIFIKGRLKRMIIRPDGHNVWPSAIEDVLLRHSAISECVCVGTANHEGLNGRIPTAFLVVKDGFKESDELLNELDDLSKVYLPERDTASAYRFIKEIPKTSVGKIDYRQLEQM